MLQRQDYMYTDNSFVTVKTDFVLPFSISCLNRKVLFLYGNSNSNFHKSNVGITGVTTTRRVTYRSRCAVVKPIVLLQSQMGHLAGC